MDDEKGFEFYEWLVLKFFVPKFLRVCGNITFRLYEHFVEHGKLIWILCAPNISLIVISFLIDYPTS